MHLWLTKQAGLYEWRRCSGIFNVKNQTGGLCSRCCSRLGLRREILLLEHSSHPLSDFKLKRNAAMSNCTKVRIRCIYCQCEKSEIVMKKGLFSIFMSEWKQSFIKKKRQKLYFNPKISLKWVTYRSQTSEFFWVSVFYYFMDTSIEQMKTHVQGQTSLTQYAFTPPWKLKVSHCFIQFELFTFVNKIRLPQCVSIA